MTESIEVGGVGFGPGQPLAIIAGPCVIEDQDELLATARTLRDTCAGLGLGFVFKASFDKANRTSRSSYRGPGLVQGLEAMAMVRRELGVPVTTDVHLPGQAEAVAEGVDLLQIPAFLCRQTDLLVACGATGRPVNIKKGQFVAPWDMGHAVDKVRHAGACGVLLTERGTAFGYNNLVVDMRGLAELAKHGVPVVFDATHSTQLPGAGGTTSGGQREHAPLLARAAVAAGAHGVFAEVHPEPSRALSDASTQLPLGGISKLFGTLARIRGAIEASDA